MPYHLANSQEFCQLKSRELTEKFIDIFRQDTPDFSQEMNAVVLLLNKLAIHVLLCVLLVNVIRQFF